MSSNRSDEVRDYAFADQVLALRKRAGLTQHDLAGMLGVSCQSIHAWEAGISYPGTERLKQIISLYLDQGAFVAGREEQEATALWATVRKKASRRTLPFDRTWFESLLVADGVEGEPRTNLPPERTPLIGREADARTILETLESTAQSERRLLTLAGVAGAGKSRLALSVSQKAVDTFRDGVWLVDLAQLPPSHDADPAPVLTATLGALGLREHPGETPIDTLVNHVGARQLLLVLDGCEQVAPACAAFATRLVSSCAEVRILATSQRSLDAPYETVFGVTTLDVPVAVPSPPTATDLELLRQSGAVQLFLERAKAVQPGFVLSAETASSIATICRQLDGLPLAIELAAARLNVQPLEDLVTGEKKGFRLLHDGGRAVIERHQTLQETMDWSYGLLDPAEQAVMRRLAVFSGGWDLAAAEAVCAGDLVKPEAVLEILDKLLDWSLVYAHVVDGLMRYGVLETIRQYGLRELERAGETIAVRDRHLSWYAKLAEQASAALVTRDQVSWMERLGREHDNLRAAMQWALDRGPSALGLLIAEGLWQFWRRRGRLSEGRRWLAAFLSRAPDDEIDTASRVTVRASALEGAAWLAEDQHEFDQASVLFAQSNALLRTLGQDEHMSSLLLKAALQARAGGTHVPMSETHPDNGHVAVVEGVSPLGIMIKVKDALASHRFYTAFGSAFKLVPVRAYGDAEFAKKFAEICPGVDCRPRKDAGIIYNISSRGGPRARLEVSEGHPDVPPGVHEKDMETAKVSIRLEVDSLAEIIRTPAYQEAARRATSDRGGFVKSYNWGTIEAPIRDPDGVVVVFVVHWDPRDPWKEEEIKQAVKEIRPKGSVRWIDERTVTEFPEAIRS
jgi:predicted ATPase/DNA-binding XRE family transcriptional regulator